ncbi:MAG: GH3 auxin-responsive promoter family protein [Bacteroidales bacterium]
MSLINTAYLLYNNRLIKELDLSSRQPELFQDKLLRYLLTHGQQTAFGKEFGLNEILSISDFQQHVPLHTYDRLEPYLLRSLKGEDNVLWDKKIYWFALSSGTSSAKSKFIPINWENLHYCHYKGMLTQLSSYVRTFPQSGLFRGRSLTLGGNRHIDKKVDTSYYFGDLSAFLLINKPQISRSFTTPPREIALMTDFEAKIEAVSDLILKQNVVSFSGVPSWNLILMRKVLEKSGKEHLHQVWPKMELFMHGGISFEPYRSQYKELFPLDTMHYLETYNASEGFFAFQTDLSDGGLQLTVNNGVFYEFIPLDKLEQALNGSYVAFDTIGTVSTGKTYAMVITTNSGLWRYLIGDTVRFTSLYPHKIKITGRTKLFINAFGEELMIENAEKALAETCEKTGSAVNEYTVAPVFMEGNGKGAHQWLIEFEKAPEDTDLFVRLLDSAIMEHNSDYEAKRLHTGTMDSPHVVILNKGCFYKWMAQENRLGGQSKVPRLWSTRQYVETLLKINEQLNDRK